MSGAGGLNAQGIKAEKRIRQCFTLAHQGEQLCGGDFSSFELTLADAVYDDPDLYGVLTSDRKLHGIMGTLLFPGKTYEEILESSGTSYDMYTMSKSAVFALLYGGNAFTLHTNIGIPMDVAEKGIAEWMKMFPGMGKSFTDVTERFSAIIQVGEGFAWVDPEQYVETKMDSNGRSSWKIPSCRSCSTWPPDPQGMG